MREQSDSQSQNSDSTLLGMAESAMELHRWAEASQWLKTVTRRQPAQPLVLFRSVRAMVRSAEWYHTAVSLGCTAHLPEAAIISEEAAKHFTRTMQELRKLSNSPEIERWKGPGDRVSSLPQAA